MAATDDPTRKQRRDAARAERRAQELALAQAAVRRRRLTVLGGVIALAAVLAVLLVVLSGSDDTAAPAPKAGETIAGQSDSRALLGGIPQAGRVLGAASAPVTLVEFADLQCPFCREYTRDALPTVVRDYVRTGKVRLEFRPRTFIGADSAKAARLVVAAGRQDKLWNTLDLFYANQGTENSGWVTDALATRVLRAAGADPAAARTAAAASSTQAELTAADTLADRNGLNSTPSFLVGRTGGTLRPLQVQALTGDAFSAALDRVAPAS